MLNGILTPTADQQNWTNRAEDWIEAHGCGYADSYRYQCGALSRRIGHGKRVAAVFTKCTHRMIAGQEVNIVAHSHGCQVAVDVLKEYRSIRINELHLIAGACYADFKDNGLNAALARNQVNRVVCYYSGTDAMLKLAKASQVFRFMGLGYGDLGRVGPQNVAEDFKKRVESMDRTGFGHSTYFEGDEPGSHFDNLMRLITGRLPGKA